MIRKRIFFVAGEVSGDTHAAALMRSLPQETVTLSGLGGPAMFEIAPLVEDWLDEAAVLGLWEVLKKYPYFRRKMEETVGRILVENPDAIVRMKDLLNGTAHRTTAERFAAEREHISALIGSPNQVEAVSAFFEKRPPNFS